MPVTQSKTAAKANPDRPAEKTKPTGKIDWLRAEKASIAPNKDFNRTQAYYELGQTSPELKPKENDTYTRRLLRGGIDDLNYYPDDPRPLSITMSAIQDNDPARVLDSLPVLTAEQRMEELSKLIQASKAQEYKDADAFLDQMAKVYGGLNKEQARLLNERFERTYYIDDHGGNLAGDLIPKHLRSPSMEQNVTFDFINGRHEFSSGKDNIRAVLLERFHKCEFGSVGFAAKGIDLVIDGLDEEAMTIAPTMREERILDANKQFSAIIDGVTVDDVLKAQETANEPWLGDVVAAEVALAGYLYANSDLQVSDVGKGVIGAKNGVVKAGKWMGGKIKGETETRAAPTAKSDGPTAAAPGGTTGRDPGSAAKVTAPGGGMMDKAGNLLSGLGGRMGGITKLLAGAEAGYIIHQTRAERAKDRRRAFGRLAACLSQEEYTILERRVRHIQEKEYKGVPAWMKATLTDEKEYQAHLDLRNKIRPDRALAQHVADLKNAKLTLAQLKDLKKKDSTRFSGVNIYESYPTVLGDIYESAIDTKGKVDLYVELFDLSDLAPKGTNFSAHLAAVVKELESGKAAKFSSLLTNVRAKGNGAFEALEYIYRAQNKGQEFEKLVATAPVNEGERLNLFLDLRNVNLATTVQAVFDPPYADRDLLNQLRDLRIDLESSEFTELSGLSTNYINLVDRCYMQQEYDELVAEELAVADTGMVDRELKKQVLTAIRATRSQSTKQNELALDSGRLYANIKKHPKLKALITDTDVSTALMHADTNLATFKFEGLVAELGKGDVETGLADALIPAYSSNFSVIDSRLAEVLIAIDAGEKPEAVVAKVEEFLKQFSAIETAARFKSQAFHLKDRKIEEELQAILDAYPELKEKDELQESLNWLML